jgi:hypothetical protein
MHDTQGVAWEEYHDRSGGLMLFGLLQMGIGLLFLLSILLLGFSWLVSSQMPTGVTQQQPASTFIMAGLFSLLTAVLFFTLGVGSMLPRRWARSLSLAIWTLALAYGVMAFAMWLLFSPLMLQAFQGTLAAGAGSSGSSSPPPMPQEMATFMVIFVTALIGFMGLAVPLPFVLFYRSKHVKATCEWRDPVPRWTDRVSVRC